MKSNVALLPLALAAVCGVVLLGCAPMGSGSTDETKEPHYLTGKNRANAWDYQGAIEAFEKALEENPRSAKAHYELGYLFTEKVPDPAAAIYHYEKCLKLQPRVGDADLIRQRIQVLKQDLVKNVLPPSFTPADHRKFEQLAAQIQLLRLDNQRLTNENRQMRDELEKWRAFYDSQRAAASVQQTSPQLQPTAVEHVAQNTTLVDSTPSLQASETRTHKVQPGETPVGISRKYGVRLDAFMAANPGLIPTKMRIGQLVNVPAS